MEYRVFGKTVVARIDRGEEILDKLHETFGTDVSDDALRDAVRRYNEVCEVINEIGVYRKLDDPTI